VGAAPCRQPTPSVPALSWLNDGAMLVRILRNTVCRICAHSDASRRMYPKRPTHGIIHSS
jgi:hypothetical protein